MHDTELINQFVELRVQGLSIPKISEKIGVPAATLYHWNERARPRVHKLRLLALEQVEERILGAQQAQCESLARNLKVIDDQVTAEIADGVEQFTLPELIRMAASLRRQLHRLKLHVADPMSEYQGCVYAEEPPAIVLSRPSSAPERGPVAKDPADVASENS